MLKRHLREQDKNQKFFQHTSKQLKRQDMNDVKSLHTTKNKNKKFHAYCVKKQFSLYVSSYDVYIKKSVFAIYSYIDLK